jgi:two-component system chemotaxis sensor kinase CheA
MSATRHLGLFLSDSRELLGSLESDLVRFEQAGSDPERRALLDAIFRHLHSLKGSAGMMGLDPIALVAHLSEQVAGEARSGIRPISTREIDLLLDACDGMRVMTNRVGAGQSIEPPAALLQKLSGMLGGKVLEAAEAASDVAEPIRLPEGPHTVIRIHVSQGSPTPAARAFIALRRVEASAEVIATSPGRKSLREGRLPGRVLTVALRGTHTSEAVEALLARVPAVERIEIISGPTDAATAPAASDGTLAPAAPGDRSVKVDVDLLDQFLELSGELVLSSGRLREAVKHSALTERVPLEEEIDRLGRLVKDLNARVLATRQTPLQHLTERLPRVVRDLARRLGKPLQLRVEGAEVTLDRGVLDALTDPLIHVIRNAADHGIEPAEERARLGKPPAGTLIVSARRERDRVVIELRDDGAGFDVPRLRDRAVQAGALRAAEAGGLSEEAALRLALLPGLTTRDRTSDVSGRGVGLDAVLVSIEQLGGVVGLHSEPGVGSCVRFVLPATVSIVNLLLVDLGGEVFGMPMSKVLYAAEGDLDTGAAEGASTRVIQLGNERVAAWSLGRLVGLPETSHGRRPFVVVEGEGLRAAVGVDRLLGQEEVLLRPLGPPLEKIRGLAGTAILGSGRPIFVLDVPRLVA